MSATTTQQVNLFRATLSSRQSSAARGKVALVASAVIVAAVAAIGQTAYGAWQAQQKLKQLERDVATAEATLKSRQAEMLQNADGVDIAALEKAVADLRASAATLESQVGSAQVSYAGVLVALARNVVPGVRLTLVELKQGVAEVRMEGLALDPVKVTEYLTRLRADPALDGVDLDGLRIGAAEPGKDGPVSFVLTSDPAKD